MFVINNGRSEYMKKLRLLIIAALLIIISACGNDDEFVIKVDTPIADSIKMDTDVIGTDLERDGTKVVTLKQCIDGDTADFTTGYIHNGQEVTRVRFMGIDTPETHHKDKGVEPFGNAAAQFTCMILTNAKEIVLQLDNGDNHFETYGRLLAYVWVDGKLLNAQIAELGLAQVSITSTSKYWSDINACYFSARKKKLGVNGFELDPNWDYKAQKEKKCSKYTCVINKSYEYKFEFSK